MSPSGKESNNSDEEASGKKMFNVGDPGTLEKDGIHDVETSKYVYDAEEPRRGDRAGPEIKFFLGKCERIDAGRRVLEDVDEADVYFRDVVWHQGRETHGEAEQKWKWKWRRKRKMET
jgi:hypothetical protein